MNNLSIPWEWSGWIAFAIVAPLISYFAYDVWFGNSAREAKLMYGNKGE